jgi:hypothetical protein
MAQDYSPKIITDNLVLCLDPSHNKSYPFSTLPVNGGLIMWMDAADDSAFSYSSGTTVSQWRDKSGSNYHMVPVSAGPTRNAFLNSRKVLAFTTSQQIWNSSINLVNSAYTVFCVTRLTGTTNSRVLSTQYTGAAGTNWLLGHWGGYVNQYYAEGWVAYATYAADAIWRIYMGDWSGTSTDLANCYSNGTAIATNDSGAQAGPLGLGINIFASETSTCEAAEIIVFNRVLSTQERRLIHTYLGQKWGILNTDRSIIDLSGNGYNGLLGNGTTTNMPIYDYYNKGALRFDGTDDYVVATVSNITASSTVAMWIKSSSYNNKIPLSIDGDAYSSGPNIYFTSNVINWNTGDGAANPFSNSSYPDSNWHYIVVTNDAATNAKLYIDGVLIGTATYKSTLSTGSNNFWLGRFHGDNNYTINANIAAAQIYSKVLSASEIRQVYEMQKTKFLNTIVQDGLVLNLDAANPSSYSGAGSTWYDVSGNGYDFTLAASGITWNSGGYFSLADGAATRSSSVTSSSTCTIVVWLRTTDTQALLFKGNNNDAYYIAAYYPGQGFYSNNAGSPTYWIDLNSVSDPSSTYLDNRWHMWEIKNVNLSSWTLFEFNKYAGFTFGNGAVGMIMIYNKSLSSAESLRNYNATKGRFGIL